MIEILIIFSIMWFCLMCYEIRYLNKYKKKSKNKITVVLTIIIETFIVLVTYIVYAYLWLKIFKVI